MLKTHCEFVRTSIWPQPLKITVNGSKWHIFPSEPNLVSFTPKAIDAYKAHMNELWSIYSKIIYETTPDWLNDSYTDFKESSQVPLASVEVLIKQQGISKYPSQDSDESYTLVVSSSLIKIESNEIWGAVRALETLSQLIKRSEGQLYVPECRIEDSPRFCHRGLLVDTARHFLSVKTIKKHLDAMMHCKMNVFHWHIVDDESFPFVSEKYPELSDNGAFYKNLSVYHKQDVEEIVEYARLRGIRVIPELDSPDHTKSWGFGRPDLLTQCSPDDKDDRQLVDVGNPQIWNFLEDILRDFASKFPDKYIHLGGDEVRIRCWMSNDRIKKLMLDLGYGQSFKKLLLYYFDRLLSIATKSGKDVVFWDEVAELMRQLDTGRHLPVNSTVFQIWRSSINYKQLLSSGYRIIISFPWYLDLISYGEDWIKYYQFEPLDFDGSAEDKSRVLGGESCIWAEYVDDTNAISRTWPRAAAMAERLWSHKFDDNQPRDRIDRFRCLLVSRNIQAQPINRSGRQCPPINI
ncbi:hypothetical protein ACOME3_007134 [Neoechinorhynchus agilis]